MKSKYLTISQMAIHLGVSISTLRRWEDEGCAPPSVRTPGGQRRYEVKTSKIQHGKRKTIAYARVSSHDQKEDLIRQGKVLELYCAAKGWNFELVTDLGSGMNYRKKGLKSLIDQILESKVERLVLTHKDRLLRFGAELIFSLCEAKNVEVILIHQGEQPTFEEELSKDVLEIITVFSARLYGARSRKNKNVVDKVTEILKS
jgi:predicted site-specific integrase-resolvase